MNKPEAQFELELDDTLSINDLLRLKNQGYSVLRSAHIGNLSPYNLTLAATGIPLLCVDHNITGKDTNYFPESMLSAVEDNQIAPIGKLVCRTELQNGIYVDQVHIAGIISALPEANIFTNTEYVRANESVVSEIVDIVHSEQPGHFNRIARPDGSVEKDENASLLLGRLDILQLSDDPRAEKSAIIIPNVADILANFVIESMKSEKAVQYHLSGPDMVVYIRDLMPDLKFLYSRVKELASFGDKLPNTLMVRLVPTAPAKFATTMERSEDLEALIVEYDNYQTEIQDIKERKSIFFQSTDSKDGDKRAAVISQTKIQQSIIESALAERMQAVPELFVEPKETGFITQYDVSKEGGLYIAPQNRTLIMANLAQMFKTIQDVKKRVSS